jgi:hypothetical protein
VEDQAKQSSSLTGEVPIQTVAECINAYRVAVERGDAVNSGRVLEACGRLELDVAEWRQLKPFLEQQGFNTLLEVVTRRLIASEAPAELDPYVTLATQLLRSGKNEKARDVILEYLARFGERPYDPWPVLNTLFSANAYGEALQVARAYLRNSPRNFTYLAMECRCLWSLNQRSTARAKLRALRLLLNTDADEWAWFVAIAQELEERRVSKAAVQTLLALIETGRAVISASTIYLFLKESLFDECQRLVRQAQPENYTKPTELKALFAYAWDFGAYETAARFGARMMEVAPDVDTREKLAQLPAKIAGSRFLAFSSDNL